MRKAKIAISINEDLLKSIDSKIDGSKIRSRSQSIEVHIRKGLESKAVNAGAIMLSKNHHWAALKKMKGKSLIRHHVDTLKNAGLGRIFILTQHSSDLEKIKDELVGQPVEVLITNASTNAEAVLELKDIAKEDFVVLAGDTYHEFDLSGMIQRHMTANSTATMALMTKSSPAKYGNAVLDGDRIVAFEEKPRKPQTHIANAGAYVFSPEIFGQLKRGMSLEEGVFPQLARQKQLVGYFTRDFTHVGGEE